MILLDPPVAGAHYDPFNGSVVDRRYSPLGADSGTTTVAGGVATLALASGDPGVRNQALAWLAAADVLKASLKITAHSLSDPPVGGSRRAAGLLAFTDEDNVDFVGVIHDAGGLAIGADSWRAGVLTPGPRVVYTEGAVSVRFERDGADLVLYAAIGNEAEQVVATVADFPLTPGKAAVLLQTNQDACQASFDDFRVETAARIDRVSDLVFGCHIRPRLVVEGAGLPADMIAGYMPWDFSAFEAAGVTVNAAGTRAEIVLPKVVASASKLLWFGQGEDILFVEPIVVRHSDAGWRIMRQLLPKGRYTTDRENLFNQVLAIAWSQELDRIDAAGIDLMEKEIHPETSTWALPLLEELYDVRPGLLDSLATRRARVLARATRRLSITPGFLNLLVAVVLPGRIVVENDPFSVYGGLRWQYQVYESTPGELPHQDWAALTEDLNNYGPGYALGAVGHRGFVAGASTVGRDFVNSVEEA